MAVPKILTYLEKVYAKRFPNARKTMSYMRNTTQVIYLGCSNYHKLKLVMSVVLADLWHWTFRDIWSTAWSTWNGTVPRKWYKPKMLWHFIWCIYHWILQFSNFILNRIQTKADVFLCFKRNVFVKNPNSELLMKWQPSDINCLERFVLIFYF